MRRPPISAPDERNAGRLDEGEPSDVVFERVDRLAAEFLERRRRGEQPTIAEYVAGHPDLAAAIRELFPALVMVEGLKPGSDETFGVAGGFDAPAEGAPPDRLGDYRILREIGRGGMGVVYEAEQESLGRRVALKVLGSWAGASEEQVRRFHREARAAAQLHHTHIVPVFGVGEHAGRHFYTMQFIHGAGLHQVIDELRRLEGLDPGASADPAVGPDDATVVGGTAQSFLSVWLAPVGSGHGGMIRGPDGPGGPAAAIGAAERMASTVVDSRRRSVRIVARIGLQVAEALAHAHEQGVLHRDIKPSNILIDGHGHAWVTDFGLAKAVDDEDLTHTGDLVGTIRYMAPERFRGECDPRSDVYALGLTLYELLGRRPAFPDSDRHALMHKVAEVDPPRLESLAVGVPRDLATIVHKAIEKAPADRYRSGAAMASDLRRFLDDRPIEARRIGLPERLLRWARRNPGVAALATTVAVLLVAIAALSTVAALRLRDRDRELERRLWEAYLARARASRRSGIEGRRFDALYALSEAARLDALPERRAALRDEAIACLALADLHRIGERELPALASRWHVLDFSPDGRRLAVGEDQGLVRVLDAEGGTELAALRGPGGNVTLLRFSDDGRRLAVRYGGSILRIYDLGTGAIVLDQPVRVAAAALDFDPSGGRLAVGLRDGTVRVDHLDGRRAPVLIPGAPAPTSLRFDPTGRRLAVSWHKAKDSLIVIDLDGSGVVGRWSLADGVLSLAWSPDGRRLAAGGAYRDIFLLDPGEPSSPARVLGGHKGAVVSLDYARRGHLLASASWDGTVRLWHPESGEPLVVASSPDHWSVRFGPDDRTLGGGRDGSTCWRWEVADGDELRSRHVDHYPDSRIWPMAFFPDGSLLASAGSAGVHLFDAELRPAALLPVSGFATLPQSGFAALEVLPDGQALLVGDPSGLRRWPVRREAGRLEVGPSAPFGPMPGRLVRRVRVDARGRRVAAVLDPLPSTVVVFDADGAGSPIQIRDHDRLERLDISPDGRLVATGTWKGHGVKVWDASTGKLVIALKVDGSAEVAFSPDGRSLLTGSGREYVCWDVGSWEPRWTLPRREASNLPGRVAFTADSALMAVAWSRTLVRLVDARTGAVVASFEAPTADHLAELGLSRDGAYLFVKDHGGGTRRWDLRAIRSRLDAMGIGWPELPPTGPDRRVPPAPPVRGTPTPDRERPARVLPPGRPGGPETGRAAHDESPC